MFRLSTIDEVLAEHVHRMTVPDAVGAAFVAAHDADRAEPDPFVGADGATVAGGGVDDQAMVSAIVE